MLIKLFCFFVLNLTRFANSEISCGTSAKPPGFSSNVTQQGSWPWIVSVHDIKSDAFICGGTLIGSNIVLTVSQKL